jgi:hypothetical protein
MLLLAMFAFQVKHFVCDFVLQSEYQVQRKYIYGHSAGLLHAGIHIVGSIPALLILSAPLSLIVPCLLGEFLIHYHVDWLKARFDNRRPGAEKDYAYWVVFGLDQLIHQATYLGMILLIVSTA